MGKGQAGFGISVGLGGEGEREVKHNSKVLDSGDWEDDGNMDRSQNIMRDSDFWGKILTIVYKCWVGTMVAYPNRAVSSVRWEPGI